MVDAGRGPSRDVFPFVVGCVRSGTTMLRAMLDSHSALAVPPEAYFTAPALVRAPTWERPGGIDGDAFLSALSADPSFTEWQLPVEEVRAHWRGCPPADVPAALRDLYGRSARARGKARAGDKTPAHVMNVELLAGAFPEARFVHIVRDGRDVVPSLIDMHFGPDKLAPAALFWRDRVSRGRAGGRRVGPERYREIHYEDLVQDPEPVLREVCEFFALDYEPGMLEYHTRADEVLDGLRFTHHVQGIRRPPSPSVRDWRSAMSPRDLQLFEALAGDLLEELGYERSGVSPSSRARVEATAWRAGTTVERRTRRLRIRVARKLRGGSAVPVDPTEARA